ncbi:MAG: hypothetical protein HFJ59_07295 [Clostridia bacterium]|nr:hypothetical protein [Clostridia bacterium]
MNEVLVKLYVPTIDQQYDIWLPINKKIDTIITLLVKAVNEFTKGYYTPSKMPYLYDKVTTNAFDINLRVIDTEIRNGTELIMI